MDVALSLVTIGGSWRDSAGGNGTFAFNPSLSLARPRPSPAAAFPAGLIVGQTSLLADGGILAQGQEEVTGPAPYSQGTRLLWHAGKSAFRAGGLFQPNDDADLGLFSVALGSAADSGERSIALGGAGAHGEHAVAIGFLAGAYGKDSVAIGAETTAHPTNSVALGTQAYVGFSHTRSFVYSDGGSRVESSAANQFTVRARGGTRFFSNQPMTAGVTLAPGASA